MDDVLTIGDVVAICKVAAATATRWVDTGALRGWRIPGGVPGRGDRRVLRSDLVAFLEAHGFPLTPAAYGTQRRVLVVAADAALGDALRALLAGVDGLSVEAAPNLFAAGLAAARVRPGHVVVDAAAAGRVEATILLEAVRGDRTLDPTVVTAVFPGPDVPGWAAAFDMSLRKADLHVLGAAVAAAPAGLSGGRGRRDRKEKGRE